MITGRKANSNLSIPATDLLGLGQSPCPTRRRFGCAANTVDVCGQVLQPDITTTTDLDGLQAATTLTAADNETDHLCSIPII